jgi:hypothetical protein
MKFGMYCNCDSITTDCEHSHAAIQEMLSQLKNPGSFLEEKLMGSPYEQRKLRRAAGASATTHSAGRREFVTEKIA